MRLTSNQQVGNDYLAPQKPSATDSSEEMNVDPSVVACAVPQDVQPDTHPTDSVRSSNDMVQQNELAAHFGVLDQSPLRAEGSEGIFASAASQSDHFEQAIFPLTSAKAISPLASSQVFCVGEASNAVVPSPEDHALTLPAPQSQEDVDMAPAILPPPADVPVDDPHLPGGKDVHSESDINAS